MISVIIPTYNRAHLIGETLDSIIAQTYTNWECIIVDDHSNDETNSIVEQYTKKDSRFSFYKKPKNLPKGPSASRNFGFTKAEGNYINWMDSDDLMHPKKMEIDLKAIQSGDYDFTISQSKFFTDDGSKPSKAYWNKKLWSKDPINDFILKNIGWSTNAPLWKKESLNKIVLQFDEELITAEDFIYHLMALNFNLKPIVIKLDLVNQREHSNRLNDFKKKSPFKLKVFSKLLEKEFKANLNQKTITYLHKMILRQYSNLIKFKDLKLAKEYKLVLKCILPMEYNDEINRLYKYGKLYKFTGKFYKKLNVRIE